MRPRYKGPDLRRSSDRSVSRAPHDTTDRGDCCWCSPDVEVHGTWRLIVHRDVPLCH